MQIAWLNHFPHYLKFLLTYVRIALIRYRKTGEVDKDFASDYLDLLNDSDSASNSSSLSEFEKKSLHHSNESHGSGRLLVRDSTDTELEDLVTPPVFSETKLEEEDKLLVGVAEGKEVCKRQLQY